MTENGIVYVWTCLIKDIEAVAFFATLGELGVEKKEHWPNLSKTKHVN